MDSRIMARVTATAREGYKPSDLKIADLQEVNFWVNMIENQIELALFDYPENDMPEEVAKICSSIADDFSEKFTKYIEAEIHDILISIIDNYEEEE